MALPTAYLTSAKNVGDVFTAIQAGQAPKQFTINFLQGLGFKSSADRLYIPILKALGFLTQNGTPTNRYFEYLDQSQSARVLADAVRETYADLYELNRNAHEMTTAELKGKLKTLTQGQFSGDVLAKMAATFKAISVRADFKAVTTATPETSEGQGDDEAATLSEDVRASREETPRIPRSLSLGGLVYNIELHLPESRDPAVYDAFFRSLKAHLFSD